MEGFFFENGERRITFGNAFILILPLELQKKDFETVRHIRSRVSSACPKTSDLKLYRSERIAKGPC